MKACEVGSGFGIGVGVGLVLGIAGSTLTLDSEVFGMTPTFAILLITFGFGSVCTLVSMWIQESLKKRREAQQRQASQGPAH